MFYSKILIAGAAALALCAAGCTPAEEQGVLTAISSDCTGAVTGTTMVVSIVSSLAGAAPVATLSSTVGANAAGICSSLLAQAQAAIEAITALGGTATVTVSSATPQGIKKSYKLRFKAGATPGAPPQVFVVTPSPF